MFYTKICCDARLANEGKKLFWLTPNRSILTINKVGIWMLAQTSGLFVTWLSQHNLIYEKAKWSTTLCPNHFSLPIGFHCNSKDASTFYLMSSGSCGFKRLYITSHSPLEPPPIPTTDLLQAWFFFVMNFSHLVTKKEKGGGRPPLIPTIDLLEAFFFLVVNFSHLVTKKRKGGGGGGGGGETNDLFVL